VAEMMVKVALEELTKVLKKVRLADVAGGEEGGGCGEGKGGMWCRGRRNSRDALRKFEGYFEGEPGGKERVRGEE
jgi:hypothetical protein